MGQFTLVQLESLWVSIPFRGLPVDDKDTRDLGKLSEYDLVVVFNHADDAIGKQVSVPLVIFALVQTFKIGWQNLSPISDHPDLIGALVLARVNSS